MEPLFGKKRNNSFSASKDEPAVKKQVKYDNKESQGQKNKGRKEPPTTKVREDLKGSKFRLLNEYLYTTDSKESVKYFADNKELFDQYHEGFASQMHSWPLNPVDVIIKHLAKNSAYNDTVICDLGCGEGKLYEYFQEKGMIKEDGEENVEEEEPEEEESKGEKKPKNKFRKIYSFDLVSRKDHITACDIANLPLDNRAVDVCVFSLALMGTNYLDFLLEAHRVLRTGGYLIIAEVLSRMPNRALFVKLVKALGFKFVKYKKNGTFFVILIFTKVNGRPKNKQEKIRIEDKDKLKKLPNRVKDLNNITLDEASKLFLLPCIYKRR